MKSPLQRAAGALNAAVLPFVSSRLGSRLVGDRMTVVSYTGRRSGRQFRLPVAYRRTGRQVAIGVELPDQKGWWRNFTGAGNRLSLRLDGAELPGHGTARRDADGEVSVSVLLDR